MIRPLAGFFCIFCSFLVFGPRSMAYEAVRWP
jgi:hypothetical protein